MDILQHFLAAAAAFAAGLVNALAGGGTLITFPTLTALGVPAIAANVTNTVALAPGYLGAALAQSRDLKGQKQRLWLFLPVAVLGGIAGGILLLQTEEKLFRGLVPFLILLGSALLAIQDLVKRNLLKSRSSAEGSGSGTLALIPVGLAAVYGGYFGAGLSVIVLAALALFLEDSLTRLNALKQSISFAVNVATAIFFLFSGQVLWSFAAVMAVGAIAGGVIGGKLAGRIPASTLRWTVVVVGVLVAVIFFLKG